MITKINFKELEEAIATYKAVKRKKIVTEKEILAERRLTLV